MTSLKNWNIPSSLIALLDFLVGNVWPWGTLDIIEHIDLRMLVFPVFAMRRIFDLSWRRAIIAAIALELVFLPMMSWV